MTVIGVQLWALIKMLPVWIKWRKGLGCLGQNMSQYYIACTFFKDMVGGIIKCYKEIVLTEIWD